MLREIIEQSTCPFLGEPPVDLFRSLGRGGADHPQGTDDVCGVPTRQLLYLPDQAVKTLAVAFVGKIKPGLRLAEMDIYGVCRFSRRGLSGGVEPTGNRAKGRHEKHNETYQSQ